MDVLGMARKLLQSGNVTEIEKVVNKQLEDWGLSQNERAVIIQGYVHKKKKDQAASHLGMTISELNSSLNSAMGKIKSRMGLK